MKKRIHYWLLINLIIVFSVVCFALSVSIMRLLGMTGCAFYDFTGLYCPGCGGTRALESLLRLDIISSLKYNAILLPAVILFIYYDIRSFIAVSHSDDDYFLDNKYIPVLIFTIFLVVYSITRSVLLFCGIDVMQL